MCGAEENDQFSKIGAGRREKLQRAADAAGVSLNEYLNMIIDEAIAREEAQGQTPENDPGC